MSKEISDKTSDKKTSELLKCPFCGGEALLNVIEPHKHEFATFMPDYGGGSFIECTKCTCAMSGETSEEVVKAWNNRKPMQNIVERLEEEFRFSDSEKHRCIKENPLQFDYAKGYAYGIYNAIAIVKEEGGV